MDVVELIKSKLSLSDIVRKDVVLEKKGNEYVGKCPFHLEKTASFFVSDIKKSFHCFGCGISGDIFKYVMQRKNITFKQALLELAEIAHVNLEVKKDNNSLYKILSIAWTFFRSKINDSISQQYIVSRNLNDNNIGYAPLYYDLYNELLKLFPVNDIHNSGLFIVNNNQITPRFRNRLIFPIFNTNNVLIAFGGRLLSSSKIAPKYLNSPDSNIFHKHLTLFMLNHAIKHINSISPPIIVEGYIDVLTLHKYGFNTAVGTMGTALSHQHLELLWKFSDNPIICLDGDNAGQTAMKKVAALSLKILQPGKSVNFCILPKDTDPDDFLNFYGASAFNKLLQRKLTLVDFLWRDFILNSGIEQKNTPENIAKLETDLFNLINTIPNDRIRNLYISNIRKRLYESRAFNKKYNCNTEIKDLNPQILLYILIQKPHLVSFVVEDFTNLDFGSNKLNLIRDFILMQGTSFNEGHNYLQYHKENNHLQYCEVQSVNTANNTNDNIKIGNNNSNVLLHNLEKGLVNVNSNLTVLNQCITNTNSNNKSIEDLKKTPDSINTLPDMHIRVTNPQKIMSDDLMCNNNTNDLNIISNYTDTINSIINTINTNCCKNFSFEQKSDEELINEWYDLFNRVFSIKQEKCDLHCASQECRRNISTNTWTRLKNLKMYLLRKGKH